MFTASHSQFQMALLSLVSFNIQALILLADSGDVEENDSPGLRLKPSSAAGNGRSIYGKSVQVVLWKYARICTIGIDLGWSCCVSSLIHFGVQVRTYNQTLDMAIVCDACCQGEKQNFHQASWATLWQRTAQVHNILQPHNHSACFGTCLLQLPKPTFFPIILPLRSQVNFLATTVSHKSHRLPTATTESLACSTCPK